MTLVPVALALGLTLVVPTVSGAAPSDELRSELRDAEDELADLDTQAQIAIEDHAEAAATLAQVEANLAATEDEAAALRDRVGTLQSQTELYVRRLYQLGPTVELAALFGADGPAEAGSRVTTIQRLSAQNRGDIEELAAQRVSLVAVEERLAGHREEAAALAVELEERRDAVERLVALKQGEVNGLEQDLAAAVQREREAAERRAREAAERRRAAEAARRAREEAAATVSRVPDAPSTRKGAQAAVDEAVAQVGKPYRWGGSGPDSFDCSGLTAWGWRAAGVHLPHSSRMQYSATRRVGRSDLQPGDLVFFGSPIHHVAMYIGGGKVVEAPYSGQNVRISSSALGRSDIAGYGRP